MKDVKLTIIINKPIWDVFEFTTNPNNTPKWIDSIIKKESNSKQVEVGTTFKNWDDSGKMNEYQVTKYESPKVFQLDAIHQDYKVKYTYNEISDNETELEYYEWSESGQLHSPSMQEILNKLKTVMETSI